jgi:hypothetical protein
LAKGDHAAWEAILAQARRALLLARLEWTLGERSPEGEPPAAARRRLHSARLVADRHGTVLRTEVDRLHRVLARAGIPLVLLKGGAYLVAGLPASRGRLFGDIDILVPRGALEETEAVLHRHGWLPVKLDAYDQRYYRQWMHELPPLRHVRRQTTLDVHHTILPPTARLKPDPRKLLSAAVPVPGYEELYVLAPADMVLHSATHLFHDGELEHGLRDLVDLDDLLRHFGADPEFWPALVDRAHEMDLARPLFYGVRYATRILGTPVPGEVVTALDRAGPREPARAWMDALFERGLAPAHASCADRLTPLARWLLYVRSHYLRMPLRLLVPHLVRKAMKRRREGGA